MLPPVTEVHPRSEMAAGERSCSDCGAPIHPGARFCGHCGQRDVELHPRLLDLVRHVMREALDVDSRIARSLPLLFFRPGELSRQHNAGRRTRYTSPLRLLLLALAVNLLGLALSPDKTVELITDGVLVGSDWVRRENGGDTLQKFQDPEGTVLTAIAEAVRGDAVDERASPWMARKMENAAEQFEMLAQQTPEQRRATYGRLNQELMAYTHRAFVLCIPVLALTLQLLYRRQRRVYVEHLVFSTHFISVYLLFSTASYFSTLAGLSASLVGLVYLWFAMRRFYGESKQRTTLKVSVLALILMCASLVAIAFALLMVLMSL